MATTSSGLIERVDPKSANHLMPILKNTRWELFAQALAQGKPADTAYVEAGYKENRGNAATLKANQSVAARIAELQAKGARKVMVTQESLEAELEEARQLALREKSPGAAVAATMGKAKVFGIGADKLVVSSNLAELLAQEVPTPANTNQRGVVSGVVEPVNTTGVA